MELVAFNVSLPIRVVVQTHTLNDYHNSSYPQCSQSVTFKNERFAGVIEVRISRIRANLMKD